MKQTDPDKKKNNIYSTEALSSDDCCCYSKKCVLRVYIVYSSDVVLTIVSINARLSLLLKLGYDMISEHDDGIADHRVKEVEYVWHVCKLCWRFIGIPAKALVTILLKFMVEN